MKRILLRAELVRVDDDGVVLVRMLPGSVDHNRPKLADGHAR